MMKCEQARLLIGADPSAVTPVVEAHVAGCGDCADYWREMHTLDGELRLAMRWPREAGAASGKIVPLRRGGSGGRAARVEAPPSGKDDGDAGSDGGAAAGLAASAHPGRLRGAGRSRPACCWRACWQPPSSSCGRRRRWRRRWWRTWARNRMPGSGSGRFRSRCSIWCCVGPGCDLTGSGLARSSTRTAATCAAARCRTWSLRPPRGPVTVLVLTR